MIFVNQKFLKVLSNPRANMKYEYEKFRGSDLDPYWIRIQSIGSGFNQVSGSGSVSESGSGSRWAKITHKEEKK
jgi:hypothetical protein